MWGWRLEDAPSFPGQWNHHAREDPNDYPRKQSQVSQSCRHNTSSRCNSGCSPTCSTHWCNMIPSHSPSHSNSHNPNHPNNARHTRRHNTLPKLPAQHQDSHSVSAITYRQPVDPRLSMRRYPSSPSMLLTVRSHSTPGFHLTTRTGTKHLTVKIDPDASVNTIPLSRYGKIFPHKIAASKYFKPSLLNPTNHSCISHDGSAQPFLGQFIADIRHVSQARSYLTCFYIFKDDTSPHILLSGTTSEWLGIIQFSVLLAQEHTNAITFPTTSGLRKMVTSKDPLTTKIPQPHWYPSISPSSSHLRKTAKTVTFRDPARTIHLPTITLP